MRKFLLALIAVCVLCFGLVACTNPTPTKDYGAVKGETFVFKNAEIKFQEGAPAEKQNEIRALFISLNITLEFKNDGSYVLTEGEDVKEGTYVFQEGVVTLNPKDLTASPMQGQLSGETLRFLMPDALTNELAQYVFDLTFVYQMRK